MTIRVTAKFPHQVVHDGVVVRPGESADVPDDVARNWYARGWIERPTDADKPAKRAPAKGRR